METKYTSSVEQGHSEAHELLDEKLRSVDVWVASRVELFVQIVLAERQDRNQVGTLSDRELDEALTLLEHELEGTRAGVEGLAGTTHNNGDCTTHSFAVTTTLGENVLATFPRHGRKAHAESVVTVDWNAEVGIEGEEGVGNAREKLFEAQRFSGKSGERTV